VGSSTEATVLATLERAEMAARERRLAASTEAERIATVGRERASAITSRAERRVADALEALRKEAASGADRAIEALQREAAKRAGASAGPTDADPAFDGAVDLVVASILGEGRSPHGDEDAA